MSYIEDVKRSESPKFFTVSDYHFNRIMFDACFANHGIEKLKKAIFYGKEIEKWQIGNGNSLITEGLTDTQKRLLHAALGMVGEAGEVLELIFDHIAEGKELHPDALILEAGDVMWYQGILLDAMGWTFEQVQEANINKLKARYPEKFEEEIAVSLPSSESKAA